MAYTPKNPIRIVTAAALFDGHDASINIMRRILQDMGAEVIHLGHNRSVSDVVKAVLQEGAQGVCISSYQGGHMEYFKYMKDLLDEAGAGYVKIYGGGGGVIVFDEKKELEAYGIAQIFHPEDGRRMGLEGMIEMIIKGCDFDLLEKQKEFKTKKNIFNGDTVPSVELGVALTAIENGHKDFSLNAFGLESFKANKEPLVLGITGTGGAGKSSLIDEMVQRYLNAYPDKKIAVVCVDPSKRKTGGSLLGDRIRMNSLSRNRVFMRSVASRGSGREIASSLPDILKFIRQLDFDFVIAETSGIGQGNMAITEVSDMSMYVMTSDFGAQSQLEKIDMIDFADLVAVNKADRRGALDALRDVTKQYKRSRKIFDEKVEVPVFLTQASQFNDGGVNKLFFRLADILESKQPGKWVVNAQYKNNILSAEEHVIIPADRQNYLAEITSTIHKYKKRTETLAEKASQLGGLQKVAPLLNADPATVKKVEADLSSEFTAEELDQLKNFEGLIKTYSGDELVFKVRDKELRQPMVRESLSGTKIRRVVVPKFKDWGDRFRYLKLENVPGEFPFTAGVFQLKRADEDPKRMFAGEGTPERTNRRFHYLTKGETAHRLSTAFDSVTLYGQDPDQRPDIFGKVGESGVSICTLNDMKKLYAGFDLINPNTSVSMTINGPAPMILAFYFNTAIDQQVEKKEKELGRKLTESEWNDLAVWTLQQVRGTVQADILKEDQGQNTCIFSINFALKMMGDIQEYFVRSKIRNFYSVSISGYHIAEAGANPISQLAFTLSNGFTFVEYYLARGLKVDDFAPNLSFFFSNGLDPEYSVLGRVARRIWAVAMRDLYKGNDRSQKLKYHIQTSGRSLHAQEIDFNDIRTTLQALIALYDNCNSLHTNAYDEAITTPTEESVRRAMAIQLIINREFGMTMNENPMQGSFFIDELTDLVEEAVLNEFKKINERGGVLGAMETQYQRSKIQEESLYYERLKHDGTLPIIGVNTFIDPKTMAADYVPPKIELARASYEEKNAQLDNVHKYQEDHASEGAKSLQNLKDTVLSGGNIFAALMTAARYCSLYQMTQALYEVGGQYRRNL
ncbi:fused isobutyryl-CoA mutase/GTPase IcmF [Bdellovibrio bacteriovorus]|uniref:Fused isobutyryl-CoA mutase n=1 Tax=Bdellovibrio bacteriovorus (strain ATCC 15356 / DSM 50701 / NCIMB 9529 / HD100) TaxID=264462 RepID=Q6MLZ8_BDEBA|nr:fused isobutyryl-CoA mutase/GTPase IcmF [Bdellovibrio bacteriovorus]BEV68249.1 Fused isobutyryl-CoA mutase [Bdellovibrio bacteriovorus]CAE79708.1 methylmalonyl-CoA mutase [Bdellovibrio bacteriovorus HD100]